MAQAGAKRKSFLVLVDSMSTFTNTKKSSILEIEGTPEATAERNAQEMKVLKRSNYFTPPEAAEVMMCSALHVRHLIRMNQLPVYQVGRRSYIPKAALYAYIKSKTIPAENINK